MNEAETRAEYIDPTLKESGWGEVEGSKVLREFRITEGRIQSGGERGKKEIADYVLVYKNQKLAVIEAKSAELSCTEGVQQAKDYAEKLQTPYTFSTNGEEIYQILMINGQENHITSFPSPVDLWTMANSGYNEWREKFGVSSRQSPHLIIAKQFPKFPQEI
ncbi:MAG: type I restriction endonuclease [bacterium]|nr:type I restriction endonuclease [bacterium]